MLCFGFVRGGGGGVVGGFEFVGGRTNASPNKLNNNNKPNNKTTLPDEIHSQPGPIWYSMKSMS